MDIYLDTIVNLINRMNCGVLPHSYRYLKIHIMKYVINHSMKNIFTILAHTNLCSKNSQEYCALSNVSPSMKLLEFQNILRG